MECATCTFRTGLTQLTSIVPIYATGADTGIHAAAIGKQGTGSVQLMEVPIPATVKVVTELDARVYFTSDINGYDDIIANPRTATDLGTVSFP